MAKAYDYITKELGFIPVDVDFNTKTIGEGIGEEDYVFVNFNREIIFKWASGYDPVCITGELKEEEERKIHELDVGD